MTSRDFVPHGRAITARLQAVAYHYNLRVGTAAPTLGSVRGGGKPLTDAQVASPRRSLLFGGSGACPHDTICARCFRNRPPSVRTQRTPTMPWKPRCGPYVPVFFSQQYRCDEFRINEAPRVDHAPWFEAVKFDFDANKTRLPPPLRKRRRLHSKPATEVKRSPSARTHRANKPNTPRRRSTAVVSGQIERARVQATHPKMCQKAIAPPNVWVRPPAKLYKAKWSRTRSSKSCFRSSISGQGKRRAERLGMLRGGGGNDGGSRNSSARR